jgi:hypothetical protein
MAEAVSIAESVLAILKLGQWISRRIRIYRNAPDLLRELKELGLEASKGDFHLDLKLAEALVATQRADGLGDPNLSTQLSRQLTRLKTGLDSAHVVVERSFDSRGRTNDVYFALRGHGALTRCLADLRSARHDFYQLASSVDLLRRARTSLALDHRRLALSLRPDGRPDTERVGDAPQARVARAEWRGIDGEVRYGRILLEQQDLAGRDRAAVIETLVYLAAHLPRSASRESGMLSCLGYRDNAPADPELVFELPAPCTTLQTLRSMLLNACDWGEADKKMGIVGQGSFSKANRLILAQRIANAVAHTLRTGLIHKNIRPESVLVLESSEKEDSKGGNTMIPCLINWTLARTEQMLSYRQGNTDWRMNLYRHPQRQGLYIEDRYHAGHDLYSLGVCLLEIGLATSLIVGGDDADSIPCELFRNEAIAAGLVDPDCENEDYREMKPTHVATVLNLLSQNTLTSRMGSEYANVVQRCLQCIEQGFGTVDNFQKDINELGPNYEKLVLHALQRSAVELTIDFN